MRHKKNYFRRHFGKLMAALIALLMTGSIAGIVIMDSNQNTSLEYNGYSFKQLDNGGFITQIGGKDMAFNFHPLDVESIPFTREDMDTLKAASTILITSDEGSQLQSGISLLEYETETKLAPFGISVSHGFTDNNTIGLPIISCDMANSTYPVIYIKQGEETTVQDSDGCIMVDAKNEYDVVRVKDAIIYRMLGVI